MFDDQGKIVKEAGPGRAVEVIGWRDLPSAGDVIIEVENEVLCISDCCVHISAIFKLTSETQICQI